MRDITDEFLIGDPLEVAKSFYALSIRSLQVDNHRQATAEALLGILRLQIEHAERQQR